MGGINITIGTGSIILPDYISATLTITADIGR